jgi:hypothetical protein
MTYPITPPPELVRQWSIEAEQNHQPTVAYSLVTALATRAAQWGADQELEACCEYLVRCAQWEPEDVTELRAARRPKPPSLKEQALADLDTLVGRGRSSDTIRRALEALPND